MNDRLNKRERITSIDALRALTLLGILIVHTKGGFGFKYLGPFNIIDSFIYTFISLFLEHKCNTIFSILFGVSFYLILRNPSYKGSKFLWRCFLLVLIGLFNKLLYTYDALMWYGLCGMCLVPIRKLKNNHILTIFILLFSFSYYLSNYKLGTYLFDTGGGRYSIESSLRDIIIYPNAVIDYLRIALNSGLFGTLSLFVLGYYLARVGIIENLKTKTTIQVVIFFWAAYTFLTYITIYHFNHIRFLYKLNNYMATFAYSSTIIYVYYNNSFYYLSFKS